MPKLDCESRLKAWLNESSVNVGSTDGSQRIAPEQISVDERLLLEFEETVTRIARKFKVV
jgi:hypothetical protein